MHSPAVAGAFFVVVLLDGVGAGVFAAARRGLSDAAVAAGVLASVAFALVAVAFFGGMLTARCVYMRCDAKCCCLGCCEGSEVGRGCLKDVARGQRVT